MDQGRSSKAPPDRFLFVLSGRAVIIMALVYMVVITLGLMFLDYWINYLEASDNPSVRILLSPRGEIGLYSYVGIALMFLVVVTAWEIRFKEKRAGVDPRMLIGFTLVAVFLTWLALDEALSLHEHFGRWLEQRVERSASAGEEGTAARLLRGWPSHLENAVLGPVYAVLMLLTLTFLWRSSGRSSWRWLLIVAGACFCLAGMLDLIQGLDQNHRWNLYVLISERFDLERLTTSRYPSPYAFLERTGATIEESGEMLGMTALWVCMLDQLRRINSPFKIRSDFSGRV